MTYLERIQRAFYDVCEAEKIAHAAGKDATYWALIEAHSALLRARNHEWAKEAARV